MEMDDQPQPLGFITTLKGSSEQLTKREITALDNLLLRTIAYYPNQEFANETWAEFRSAFKALAVFHGLEALELAIAEWRMGSEFFPHPGAIGRIMQERKDRDAETFRRQREEQRREDWLEKVKAEDEATRARNPADYCTMADIYADLKEKKRAQTEAGKATDAKQA